MEIKQPEFKTSEGWRVGGFETQALKLAVKLLKSVIKNEMNVLNILTVILLLK